MIQLRSSQDEATEKPMMTSQKTMMKSQEAEVLMSATKWLKTNGLARNRLKMSQILSQIGFKQSSEFVGLLEKPVTSNYGEKLFKRFQSRDGSYYNITVERRTLLQIRENLLRSEDLYKQRLRWLTSGSRQLFGVIEERAICLVLNLSPSSSFELYQQAIISFLQEQVSQIARFNLIKVQAQVVMWQNQAAPVTCESIKDATDWILGLEQEAQLDESSCIESVLLALNDSSIDAIYLINAGDACRFYQEILRHKLTSSPCHVNTISFDVTCDSTITFLRQLALHTGGRFHSFSLLRDEEEFLATGNGVRDDVYLIWKELDRCRRNLDDVDIIIGNFPSMKHCEVNISTNEKLRNEHVMTSRQWLLRHGLKRLGLRAFQILANCSFPHSDGVVDVKQKSLNWNQTDADSVRKLINAKYCDRFAHAHLNNRVFHVYVTSALLRSYEDRMRIALDVIRRRLHWLRQGSREVFGSVLEDRICIIIDASRSMKNKLSEVKEWLIQLLQEQVRTKRQFNLISIQSHSVAWKPRLCDVTPESLAEASHWLKNLQSTGSSNLLAALRIAFDDVATEAIYLLSDGRADQPDHVIWRALQQAGSLRSDDDVTGYAIPIHTIAFRCCDVTGLRFLHQLSTDTGGRHHHFGETPSAPDPFESEDVSLLKKELKTGEEDLQLVRDLRTRCVTLDCVYNRRHASKHKKIVNKVENLPKEEVPSPDEFLEDSNEIPTSSLSVCANSQIDFTEDQLLRKFQKKPETQKRAANRAKHTKSSLLRMSGSDLDGWMLPETRKMLQSQINKCKEIYQTKKKSPKKKKPVVNPLNQSNSEWLKTNNLKAQNLDLIQILSSNSVKHSSTFLPIINRHVTAKVFADVLPVAFVSSKSKSVRLVNPTAVDLISYRVRLRSCISRLQDRLDAVVRRKLPVEEQEKFGGKPFWTDLEKMMEVLERFDWPVEKREVDLLIDEIELGNKFLQQSFEVEKISKDANEERKKKNSPPDGAIEKKKVKKKSPKRSLTSKGTRVIARCSEDGFYYSGKIIKQKDSRHYVIDFDEGSNACVASRHVITRSGAVSCPTLKIGDHVLGEKVSKQFQPAIVIGTPMTSPGSGFYTLLMFDEHKIELKRNQMIKVASVDYKFMLRYIKFAQNVDKTLPAVDFVKSDVTKSELYKFVESSIDEVKKEFESLGCQLQKNEEKQMKHGMLLEKLYKRLMRGNEKKFQEIRDEIKNEQEKMNSLMENYKKDVSAEVSTTILKSILAEKQEQKNQTSEDEKTKETTTETTITKTTTTETEQSESELTTTEPTETAPTETAPTETKATSETFSQLQKEVVNNDDVAADDVAADDVAADEVAADDVVANDVASDDVAVEGETLKIGDEVLAKKEESGFYFRGIVQNIRRHGDDVIFEVSDSKDHVKEILRSDVITDEDDANCQLEIGDSVLARHPNQNETFAPALVTAFSKDLDFDLIFSDKSTSNLKRQEIFVISRVKHQEILAYINRCKMRMLGETIVARNDKDGRFELAICKKILDQDQFEVFWSDGSCGVQRNSFIFGAHSNRRPYHHGDHVIAMCDFDNLKYLAGKVFENEDGEMLIKFCDNSWVKWMPNDGKYAYLISEDHYQQISAFFKSRLN